MVLVAGWTTYLKKPAKINLDKNEPIYILGKRFNANNNSSSQSLANLDEDPNSSYDNCYYDASLTSAGGGGKSSGGDSDEFDSLKETPIYSLNAVNYDHRSPAAAYHSRVSPKGSMLSRFGRHNSSRIDATYFFVDEETPPNSGSLVKHGMTPSGPMETEKTLLDQEIHSRFWFTYRKDFEPLIGNPKYTSDCGWGCMIRSAQMLLGQALLLHFFGNSWSLYGSLKTDSDFNMYKQILIWFNDRSSLECPFGLHRLLEIADRKSSETAEKQPSRVGTWFGPTSVCLLLKDALTESFNANPLLKKIRIYCAQDCTIYKQDVMNMCCTKQQDDSDTFLPVIILVSVRLGGEELNQIYTPSLKRFLAMENCIGLIGGKPKHSLYFIGYQGDKVIYLDPHLAQPTVVISNSAASSKLTSSNHSSLMGQSFEDASIVDVRSFDNSSFHCTSPSKTSFTKLDPSLAIGFYCRTLASLNELCDLIQDMSKTEMYPIFGINVDQTFENAQNSFKVYFKDDGGDGHDQARSRAAQKTAKPVKTTEPVPPSSRVQKLSAYLQPYLTGSDNRSTNHDSRRQDTSPRRGFMNLNSLHSQAARFLSSSSSSGTGHSSSSKQKNSTSSRFHNKKEDYDDFEFI